MLDKVRQKHVIRFAIHALLLFIVISSYLNIKIACYAALTFVGLLGVFVSYHRYVQHNRASIVTFITCLAGFVLICVGIAYMYDPWYEEFHAWTLYSGIGALFVSDTIYLSYASSKNYAAHAVRRAVRYAMSLVLYSAGAISVSYLARIQVAIQEHGLQHTLQVPPDADVRCRGRSTSMNGTIALIWPEPPRDTRCVYLYWEYLRGTALFAVLFVIMIMLVLDNRHAGLGAAAQDQTQALSAKIQIARLISYILAFIGMTMLLDDMDTPWVVTDSVCGVLVAAIAFSFMAQYLRMRHTVASTTTTLDAAPALRPQPRSNYMYLPLRRR